MVDFQKPQLVLPGDATVHDRMRLSPLFKNVQGLRWNDPNQVSVEGGQTRFYNLDPQILATLAQNLSQIETGESAANSGAHKAYFINQGEAWDGKDEIVLEAHRVEAALALIQPDAPIRFGPVLHEGEIQLLEKRGVFKGLEKKKNAQGSYWTIPQGQDAASIKNRIQTNLNGVSTVIYYWDSDNKIYEQVREGGNVVGLKPSSDFYVVDANTYQQLQGQLLATFSQSAAAAFAADSPLQANVPSVDEVLQGLSQQYGIPVLNQNNPSQFGIIYFVLDDRGHVQALDYSNQSVIPNFKEGFHPPQTPEEFEKIKTEYQNKITKYPLEGISFGLAPVRFRFKQGNNIAEAVTMMPVALIPKIFISCEEIPESEKWTTFEQALPVKAWDEVMQLFQLYQQEAGVSGQVLQGCMVTEESDGMMTVKMQSTNPVINRLLRYANKAREHLEAGTVPEPGDEEFEMTMNAYELFNAVQDGQLGFKERLGKILDALDTDAMDQFIEDLEDFKEGINDKPMDPVMQAVIAGIVIQVLLLIAIGFQNQIRQGINRISPRARRMDREEIADQERIRQRVIRETENVDFDAFITRMTDVVRREGAQQLVGMDGPIQRLRAILGQPDTNNAMLIGPRGVGKSALVRFFAWLLLQDERDKDNPQREVWEVHIGRMIANQVLRGMHEARIQGVIDRALGVNEEYPGFARRVGEILRRIATATSDPQEQVRVLRDEITKMLNEGGRTAELARECLEILQEPTGFETRLAEVMRREGTEGLRDVLERAGRDQEGARADLIRALDTLAHQGRGEEAAQARAIFASAARELDGQIARFQQSGRQVIVFIDEMHAMSQEVFDLLKPYLTQRSSFIGASTPEESPGMMANKAWERRWTVVWLEPPPPERLPEILRAHQQRFERFYGVEYDEGVIEKIATISSRPGQGHEGQPAAAIALMRLAGSWAVNVSHSSRVTLGTLDEVQGLEQVRELLVRILRVQADLVVHHTLATEGRYVTYDDADLRAYVEGLDLRESPILLGELEGNYRAELAIPGLQDPEDIDVYLTELERVLTHQQEVQEGHLTRLQGVFDELVKMEVERLINPQTGLLRENETVRQYNQSRVGSGGDGVEVPAEVVELARANVLRARRFDHEEMARPVIALATQDGRQFVFSGQILRLLDQYNIRLVDGQGQTRTVEQVWEEVANAVRGDPLYNPLLGPVIDNAVTLVDTRAGQDGAPATHRESVLLVTLADVMRGDGDVSTSIVEGFINHNWRGGFFRLPEGVEVSEGRVEPSELERGLWAEVSARLGEGESLENPVVVLRNLQAILAADAEGRYASLRTELDEAQAQVDQMILRAPPSLRARREAILVASLQQRLRRREGTSGDEAHRIIDYVAPVVIDMQRRAGEQNNARARMRLFRAREEARRRGPHDLLRGR